MSRTYEDVTRYVEDQSQGKCKVLSAKTEHGVISKLFLQCEECCEVTQIDFIEK